MFIKYFPRLVALITLANILTACNQKPGTESEKASPEKVAAFKSKIKHIIIIYEENWSFDGLFGDFPGANNVWSSGIYPQVDKNGRILEKAPVPYSSTYVNPPVCDTNFKGITLTAGPYDLLKYTKDPSVKTGDMRHSFYSEQLQIDNGRMDKFIAYSDNGGYVMSYINLHDQRHLLDTLEWKLASEYTLCDNFFHSAFGGSFLNHIWFIAAASPVWNNAPQELISQPDADKPNFRDNQLTPDGYVVNTAYTVNYPHPAKANPAYLIPYQTMPTIGDRMIAANISWAWYAGGWDNTVKSKGQDEDFQYHHQPFLYFESFKHGSENKERYLKDETHFFSELNTDSLPSVCFIKPYGDDNQHPGYSDLWTGMLHAQQLIDSIKNSKYWAETAIIIVSDENGGRWDHVAPPKIDRWGPGSRIPAVIISPYAKKHFVDHTQYETVSVLKFIETRFALESLTNRDASANDLLNAFDFK